MPSRKATRALVSIALAVCFLGWGVGVCVASRPVTYRKDGTFGDFGSARNALSEPVAVALTDRGEVVVVDRDKQQVVFFSRTGKWLRAVGGRGGRNPETTLDHPSAIARDSRGRLWVSDTGNNRLVVLREDGSLLSVVGSVGSSRGRFRRPQGVAFGLGARVYVADTDNQRIQVLSADGTPVAEWTRIFSGKGRYLKAPAYVAFSRVDRGSIWVGDEEGARLDQFDLDGNWLNGLELAGVAEGAILIRGLGIEDGVGRMFVADAAGKRLLILNSDATLGSRLSFEEVGGVVPAGLAFGDFKDLFVADPRASRVLRLSRELTE